MASNKAQTSNSQHLHAAFYSNIWLLCTPHIAAWSLLHAPFTSETWQPFNVEMDLLFFLEDYTFKEADYFRGYKTVFSLGIKGLRGIVSTPRGRVGGVGDRLWEHNISWMIKLIPQTHLLKINSEFKSHRSSLKHDNSRIVSISNWYHGASQWPQPRDEGQRSCFLKISWIFKFIAHI